MKIETDLRSLIEEYDKTMQEQDEEIRQLQEEYDRDMDELLVLREHFRKVSHDK